jgi:UDP-N-acetylglucosamine 2-epimerase
LKIVTVIGARPQFIKAAELSPVLRSAGHEEIIIHTGQHYDELMSNVFFEELTVPKPDISLDVGSGPHGWQTASMLSGIELALFQQTPDYVLVYGDCNTTLAGALAAAKLEIPVGHIESGLRVFDMTMPEEINRRVTDHVSTTLFCPNGRATVNLYNEGITKGAHLTGDLMLDSLLKYEGRIVEERKFSGKGYALATIHRAENTDDPDTLLMICEGLAKVAKHLPVFFLAHPRTRKILLQTTVDTCSINLASPVSYLDMISLEKNADVIITDSGGVQKEANWLNKPCVTVREQTEWPETLTANRNLLCEVYPEQIEKAVLSQLDNPIEAIAHKPQNAAKKITEALNEEAKNCYDFASRVHTGFQGSLGIDGGGL